MTVQLKVKGYINGQEWGAIEPTIYLMSIEELSELQISSWGPVESELNRYPDEYYNKFKTEWALTTAKWQTYIYVNGGPLNSYAYWWAWNIEDYPWYWTLQL